MFLFLHCDCQHDCKLIVQLNCFAFGFQFINKQIQKRDSKTIYAVDLGVNFWLSSADSHLDFNLQIYKFTNTKER